VARNDGDGMAIDPATHELIVFGVAYSGEAIAALMTGLAAVAAAGFVGWRQTRISADQNSILRKQAETADTQADIMSLQAEIMHRQSEIELLGVRASLFDERLKVYTALKSYVQEVSRSGAAKMTIQSDETKDILARAEFLFPKDVRKAVEEVEWLAGTLKYTFDQLIETAKLRSPSPHLSTQAAKLREQLTTKLERLADMMGDEMRLYLDEE